MNHSIDQQFLSLSLQKRKIILVEHNTQYDFKSNSTDPMNIIKECGYENISTKHLIFSNLKSITNYPNISQLEYEYITKELSSILKTYRPIIFGSIEMKQSLLNQLKNSKHQSNEPISFKETHPGIQKLIYNELLIEKTGFAWSIYHCYEKDFNHLKSGATLKYKNIYNIDIPIIEYKYDSKNISFFALSHWIWTQPGGGTTFEDFGEAQIVDGSIVSTSTDPTTPNKSNLEPSNTKSIKATIEGFVRRFGSGKYSEVQIDDRITHKHLCTYGEQFGSIDDLIDGICELFGLIKKVANGICHIMMRKPKYKPSKVENLYYNTLQLLPVDYIRWANIKEYPNDQYIFMREQKRKSYIRVIKDFRTITEPILQKNKKEFDFWKLPQHAIDLFFTSRLMVMIEFLEDIKKANSPLLRNTNNLFWGIRLDSEDTKSTRFTLFFTAEDELGAENMSTPRIVWKPK